MKKGLLISAVLIAVIAGLNSKLHLISMQSGAAVQSQWPSAEAQYSRMKPSSSMAPGVTLEKKGEDKAYSKQELLEILKRGNGFVGFVYDSDIHPGQKVFSENEIDKIKNTGLISKKVKLDAKVPLRRTSDVIALYNTDTGELDLYIQDGNHGMAALLKHNKETGGASYIPVRIDSTHIIADNDPVRFVKEAEQKNLLFARDKDGGSVSLDQLRYDLRDRDEGRLLMSNLKEKKGESKLSTYPLYRSDKNYDELIVLYFLRKIDAPILRYADKKVDKDDPSFLAVLDETRNLLEEVHRSPEDAKLLEGIYFYPQK